MNSGSAGPRRTQKVGRFAPKLFSRNLFFLARSTLVRPSLVGGGFPSSLHSRDLARISSAEISSAKISSAKISSTRISSANTKFWLRKLLWNAVRLWQTWFEQVSLRFVSRSFDPGWFRTGEVPAEDFLNVQSQIRWRPIICLDVWKIRRPKFQCFLTVLKKVLVVQKCVWFRFVS